MPRFSFAVFLDAVPGREQEFNDWYNKQHLADALSLPGMAAVQRFATGPRFLDRDAPTRYMAIFEIDATSIEDAAATITGGMSMFEVSDAADMGTVYAIPLTPLTPRFTSSEEALAAASALSIR